MSSSKRRRRDTGTDSPTRISTPDTPDAAVVLIRRLMKQFSLDPVALEGDDSEHGVGTSFSQVTYHNVAPLVGLRPSNMLKDIGTFEIDRCRIPTNLFKSIMMDIDIMLMQYGPPTEQHTEEARSRFLSPIFNHLVTQFFPMLRNDPEVMINGHIGARSRIKYFFRMFGAVAILFIEMMLKVLNDAERLKAIAQVIAECDGCYSTNHTEGFSLPIHCILSDGHSFEFFKFEKTPHATFTRGCFHQDPEHLRRGLKVPDLTSIDSRLPFIINMRCICEVVFYVLMSAYIEGLGAYRNRSEEQGRLKGLKRPSLDGWVQALQLANHALAGFREAEDQRKKGDIDSADVSVHEALLTLHKSTEAMPGLYQIKLIMTSWDDAEVKKA